ncbi:MAG: GGDEF domain-containing phosphodiesterase [Jatrophihabitantaceae bacterium]
MRQLPAEPADPANLPVQLAAVLAARAFGDGRTAVLLSPDGLILQAGSRYQSIVGGQSPAGQFWPATMGAGAAGAEQVLAELSAGRQVDRIVVLIRDRPRWLRVQGWPAGQSGTEAAVLVLQIEDLTDADTASLATQLIRDPLTGSYNRRALIELAALPATATAGYHSMLIVNVRGFRRINELWGPRVGDDCLVETAAWLSALIGDDELLVRLSGSQFIVLCGQNSTVAGQLAGSASRQLMAGRRRILLSLQAGSADRPAGGSLLDCADEAERALSVAKRDAWRTVVSWTQEIASDAGQAAAEEESVLQAVAARQEAVRFQPIVNLADRRVSGVEALVRMAGPAAELPTERILAASHKLGLTPELAERVYDLAFTEGLALREVFPGCLLGINVSREFLSTRLAIDTVLGSARKAGVPLDQVVVELTEDVAAGLSTDLLASELRRGAELGMQMVIDDFGRGETSLSLLRKLPLSGIKLDRSLLPLDDDDRAWDFVAASVHLLNQLTDRIVAEGIETELQSRRMRALGIDIQQGYLFGQPETSQHWLRHGLLLPAS